MHGHRQLKTCFRNFRTEICRFVAIDVDRCPACELAFWGLRFCNGGKRLAFSKVCKGYICMC